MTKEKNDKTSGGKFPFSNYRSQIIILGIGVAVTGIYLIFPTFWKDHWIFVSLIAAGLAMLPLFSLWKFWAGYGWQVGFAPGLTFVLMGIFIWFFGYDSGTIWVDATRNLFWTNLLVLSIWLILVFFGFRSRSHGEVWRDYRWIIAPAILILLFLFDTSWAQSTLSSLSLKKSVISSTPADTLQFHAEYPSHILFDDIDQSEIRLWATGTFNCIEQEISGKGLLFAIKPPPDTPLEWSDKLTFKLNKTTTGVTLLVQPIEPQETDSRSIHLNLSSRGKTLETSDWKITVESKRASQIRGWKKNLLDTGGTVVSLITAVFVGVKQLEEEKKRQKAERVKQAIVSFETDVKDNLSKSLEKYLELVRDWREWERTLQDQFCDKFASLANTNLWRVISDKNLSSVENDIKNCLQLCVMIFQPIEQVTISKLEKLQFALQQDERALLSMLKEDSDSIVIAKRIAGNLPPNVKKKIPDEYKNEFLQQIIDLKDELGFVDIDGFPLKRQFHFYADMARLEERLAAWLEKHQMHFSPFLDHTNPYTLTPTGTKFFIEQISAGFTFPALEHPSENFEFSSPWDVSAALFEYVRGMPSKKQQDVFAVPLTPTMITNFGMEQPRELFLHALAEQWLWILAETPTLYYSLKETQRPLLGRLLCWHGGSPFAALRTLEQILGNKKEEQDTKNLLKRMAEWLKGLDATSLRREEMNSLIELRPTSNQSTLLLVPSVDRRYYVDGEITPDGHKQIDNKAEWLQAHGWSRVHFLISRMNPEKVSLPNLEKQCQQRIMTCSNGYVDALEALFSPHTEDPADLILARRANGSPSEMVRLGQKLLLQHVEKYSSDEDLHIEDLIALK